MCECGDYHPHRSKVAVLFAVIKEGAVTAEYGVSEWSTSHTHTPTHTHAHIHTHIQYCFHSTLERSLPLMWTIWSD